MRKQKNQQRRTSLLRNYFGQTRNPEGALGKMMLRGMNSGHAKLSDWGMTLLPEVPVERAVDLGCGAGGNIAELVMRYPGAQVMGIDHSELSVKTSRKANGKMIRKGLVDIQTGDVSSLNLPDDTFDLATAFETIYFWPGLEECFTEVARILKKGGTFLIVNESDGTDKSSQYFQSIIDGMSLYTEEDITEALKSAGFSDVQCTHHKKKPWITVLATK